MKFWSVSLTAAVIGVIGCATAGSQHRDPGYQMREVLDRSVIQSSQAVLSEDAIRKLLMYRVVLPEKAKLAVVGLDHRNLMAESGGYYGFYGRPGSLEFLQRKKEFLDAIEKPLWTTGRFIEISHVPHLLLEKNPSLIRLREAAALMQADLLLVYQTESQMIYDYNVFSKDEVKAHASIDLFLMDVKTGAIPYAETIEETHTEKEQGKDVDDFETRKRADYVVTLKVLKLGVEELKGFLKGPEAPAKP